MLLKPVYTIHICELIGYGPKKYGMRYWTKQEDWSTSKRKAKVEMAEMDKDQIVKPYFEYESMDSAESFYIVVGEEELFLAEWKLRHI
jgi:hypothetical protein